VSDRKRVAAGRFDTNEPWAVRAYAGVSPGWLTRWSLHLPSTACSMRNPRTPPTARLGIARTPTRGFPRIHPVRHDPLPGRAPLFGARNIVLRAPSKETAALSC
jgi:hypothetical protein